MSSIAASVLVFVVFATVVLLINRARPFLGDMEREAATLVRDLLLVTMVLLCLP